MVVAHLAGGANKSQNFISTRNISGEAPGNLYNAWNVLESRKYITCDFHFPHSTLLQAEEKRARNPVPKCPSKPLELAIGQLAG